MAENGFHPRNSQQTIPERIFQAMQSRAALAQHLGMLYDGRRNMHELLGYKPGLTYEDFRARYRRQHLAHRLPRLYPEATWARPPAVEEVDHGETDSPFEADWKALDTRLDVYGTLERLDILANLGQYAVLLIGLRGQSDLSTPATPVSSSGDVAYLTLYSEAYAQVETLEMNAGLETFGQPLFYTFHFGRGSTVARTNPSVPTRTGRVHASRVLHIAEDLLEDEVYAIPRLEPVYDLLDDIYKVEGGSAEMFWEDAKRRLVFAMRDGTQMSPDDEKALQQEVEEFVHELRNFVRVQGIDVSTILGTVASPKEHIDVILTLIAITLDVPRRIFEGTEAGHLASTQDRNEWLTRIQRRQLRYAEKRILRALIDKLLGLRALAPPRQALVLPGLAQPQPLYLVHWDNLLSLSEAEQATVAKDVATALSTYAGPGMAETIVPAPEFRSVYLGLSEVSDFPVPDLEPGADEEEDEEETPPEDEGEEDEEGAA